MTSNTLQKQYIRKQFRALRNQLTEQQQNDAASLIVKQFCCLTNNYQPRNIAAFLSNDGELSSQKVIEHCWQQDINTYLPVVNTENSGYLLFYEYTEKTPMKLNCYGIPEPDISYARRIDSSMLDCVLMPLVAFTNEGERLGMGGGFYDRTFESLKNDTSGNTHLIGLAHECQCTDSLPVDPWDISMQAIITPERCITFE